MRRVSQQTEKGFTLLEVMVAMGMFTIILLATMQIMTQSTKSFRSQKQIQANLESAQFALNLMAKELRTSSVLDSTSATPSSSIKFYDYSQSRCIEYQAIESSGTTGTVSRRSHDFTGADPDANRLNCQGYSFTVAESYVPLVTGLTGHQFQVTPSTSVNESPPNPQAGRVTVSLTVGTGGSAATTQTTVSLRDYNYIGL